MDLSGAELRIPLGRVTDSLGGSVDFWMVLSADGQLRMFSYAIEEGKRNGMMIGISPAGLDELRKVVAAADETIGKLKSEGKATGLMRL